MAAKKKKAEAAKPRKKKHRVTRARFRHRGRWSPGFEDYRVWAHDFYAAMHGLNENPAALKLSPEALVKRAADIADAQRIVQSARKPRGYPGW